MQVSPGKPGYLRVNDVRLAYAGVEDGAANMRVLMGGKAGKGRVTETAGVRGIDESDLKAAAFNQCATGQHGRATGSMAPRLPHTPPSRAGRRPASPMPTKPSVA